MFFSASGKTVAGQMAMLAFVVLALVQELHAAPLVLTNATVLTPSALSNPENKAIELLVDEVRKRTAIGLPVHHRWPDGDQPLLVIATVDRLPAFDLPAQLRKLIPTPPEPNEAFAISVKAANGRPVVFVIGRDARGTLFGIGHLLRQLRMTPGAIETPADLSVFTAPSVALRGHQLGYRPKTNSYDGWDVADWEQYIRDLVVFGLNAIELVPPRSDDAATSQHFPRPQIDMMIEMSQIADDYGLDCWVWYPALDKDYDDPATFQKSLDEWEEVFRRLPRIDAVLVPGGDPGHTPPRPLMKLLERQSDGLRRHHPRAGMWVSPQGFNSAWLAEWLTLVRDEPTWLAGVTYGPWTRMSLPELRRQLPAKYPIRLYPDITHSYLCQFPVPDWDSALAATLGREPINPRPLDQATILRRQLPNTFGFITYSEGCNDDVNKAVWSALGWNPNADVAGVLRDYGRYFLSPAIEDDVALGVFGLEQNWRGPLATNTEVERTLKRFQRLERDASPQLRRNWRFQQLLYRASFDAYVQKRLIRETAIEQRAMDSLREAPMHGALVAVANAEKTLATPVSEPGLLDLRTRIFQHAEALFQSIKMQLSVPLYGALATPRGANLDTVDLPLNNAGWLKKQFAGIRKLPDEKARLAAIDRVARWADAGPGGFYDDLGKLTAQPHLVAAGNYADDPEFRHSRLITYLVRTGSTFEDWRGSWWDHASAFYDSAVELRYEGLDPAAEYQVRVVYVPSFLPAEIRLEANGAYEVHAFRKADRLPVPVEFDIPTAATRDGKLQLRWTVNREAGETVGFGQVGEVWLLKK